MLCDDKKDDQKLNASETFMRQDEKVAVVHITLSKGNVTTSRAGRRKNSGHIDGNCSIFQRFDCMFKYYDMVRQLIN